MPKNPERIVSVEWLVAHSDDTNVVTVDVRPQDQYNAAHIPGARNLDIYPLKILDSDPAAIDGWAATMQHAFRGLGIRHDDHVIFYEDISGTSPARGVWLMEALSIGHGSMLDGGLAAWHGAGHPLSTDPVSVTSSGITVTLNRDLLATAPDIVDSLEGDRETRFIDTRNQLEWMQGTIPTSSHLDWTAHLDPAGKLKPMDEIRAMYEELAVSADDEVVTFCASGYRAAHTWLVLSELGYDHVSNYAPSWGEWDQRTDLPVEIPE